jgi:hypothetical protein
MSGARERTDLTFPGVTTDSVERRLRERVREASAGGDLPLDRMRARGEVEPLESQESARVTKADELSTVGAVRRTGLRSGFTTSDASSGDTCFPSPFPLPLTLVKMSQISAFTGRGAEDRLPVLTSDLGASTLCSPFKSCRRSVWARRVLRADSALDGACARRS